MRSPVTPRVLSVVTAYGGGQPALLARAAASLSAQRLPVGWSWEWLLVLDGDGLEGDVPPAAAPRVLRTHRRARGVAAARTLAATHATGSAVYVLDADDEVPPGALQALLGGLRRERTAAYAVGAEWDVVDGRGEVVEHRVAGLGAGRLAPGTVTAFRAAHGRCPFPPAQLLVRTDSLWAAGGWPPLAIEEDTALLLALDAVAGGVAVPGTHLRSRRHAAQSTAAPQDLPFDVAERWLERRGLVEGRPVQASASSG